MKLTQTKDGVVVEVFVKPNSAKFEVVLEADEVVVRSTEEPTKGKVNKELIKELSKLLHNRVEIISGLTSRQKILLVKGATKNQVEAVLMPK